MPENERRFIRFAALWGLAVPVTSTFGWAVGGLAQPDAFSSADDDISDLGALTASSPWLYNQIGANVTGLLIAVLALGLWRALSPDTLGGPEPSRSCSSGSESSWTGSSASTARESTRTA